MDLVEKGWMKRTFFGGLLGLWLWGLSLGPVEAAKSTLFGGSLLKQGEVALAAGIGFPDVMVHFDFANSPLFNLGVQARFNYNLGFPVFGAHAFLSVPMRISLVREDKLGVALKLDPGGTIGGGFQNALLLGFQIGVGGLVSYEVTDRLSLIFNLELPMLLGFDPDNPLRVIPGFHLPIEFHVGMELELNENFAFFLHLGGGPYIYIGGLAQRLSNFTSNVYVNGVAKLLFGIIWRR